MIRLELLRLLLFSCCNTILSIKDYQILDEFFALAKLNGRRRSSATLTGMKQRQSGKDTQR